MSKQLTNLMTAMKITPTDVTSMRQELKVPQKPVYTLKGRF